jgi:tRNA threonylcarbamoyladenosine biosynthesis protein TsaE
MQEILSNSLADTENIARDWLAKLKPQEERAVVAGFYGDLGSGKTTFTQAVGRLLGLTEPMTSPTFVIEKLYALPAGQKFKQLVHIDAYRLESGAELAKLNWAQLAADPGNLILVEWADKVADILGAHEQLHFKFINEETRQKNK